MNSLAYYHYKKLKYQLLVKELEKKLRKPIDKKIKV